MCWNFNQSLLSPAAHTIEELTCFGNLWSEISSRWQPPLTQAESKSSDLSLQMLSKLICDSFRIGKLS